MCLFFLKPDDAKYVDRPNEHTWGIYKSDGIFIANEYKVVEDVGSESGDRPLYHLVTAEKWAEYFSKSSIPQKYVID